MSFSIVLSRDYVYPAAALLPMFWLDVYQTVQVGVARQRAGVPYPQLYAEKAEAAASKEAYIFNCTQRAHQNTLEYLPVVFASTLVTSLKHPLLAASICGVFALARFGYTIGYSTGDPDRRNLYGSALFSSLSVFGLILGSTWTVVELVLETL